MRHHVFTSSGNGSYKVAILIKNTSFNKQDLLKNYVNPLVAKGISLDQIIAFTLTYNEEGKAPVKLIKAYLEDLLPELEDLGVTHLYVADANYFKVLTKQSKAEPHLGYVLDCAFEKYSFKVALGLNHQALIYNPDLQPKLELSLDALASELGGSYQALGADIIHSCWYPEELEDIRALLSTLHNHPVLTCDIETTSLRFWEAELESISFAWSAHEGVAFCIGRDNPNEKKQAICSMLKEFFELYSGTLIWHNIGYDAKILTYHLWMRHLQDTEGMLKGISTLTRNFQDTKLLAYLATNSTAGNKLGLKDLAHEFAGDYGVL